MHKIKLEQGNKYLEARKSEQEASDGCLQARKNNNVFRYKDMAQIISEICVSKNTFSL